MANGLPLLLYCQPTLSTTTGSHISDYYYSKCQPTLSTIVGVSQHLVQLLDLNTSDYYYSKCQPTLSTTPGPQHIRLTRDGPELESKIM